MTNPTNSSQGSKPGEMLSDSQRNEANLSDEQLYLERASHELVKLLDALDELGDDFEVELASDILTIEFRDGARFVLNSHRAARQLWLAAMTSAWHFDYEPTSGRWLCSRTGVELWDTLSKQVATRLGRPLVLAPRT